MATLKKYNLTGKEVGQVQIDDALVQAEANGQMVKDYIIALRANARQWSANTQTRSEVNHSTQKPHPQKGGGRARQGRLSSPQYKGGGRVHGPKPKFDQHVRINKKERIAAIRFLIAEKIRENKVHIIENSDIEAPRTKTVAAFMKKNNLAKRTLFLGESRFFEIESGDKEMDAVRINLPTDKHANFALSLRNLPKVTFALASNINGYDVMIAQDIVMTEAALQELNQWLC